MAVYMPATEMSYTQIVSGENRTLQCFDFLAQTLDRMLLDSDCDGHTLCRLLTEYTDNQRWKDSELAVPKNTERDSWYGLATNHHP